MHTEITGHAVDFIDTPSPAMMLVACPVVDACGDVTHRLELGRRVVLGDHDHRRGQREADQARAPEVPASISSGLVATTGPSSSR